MFAAGPLPKQNDHLSMRSGDVQTVHATAEYHQVQPSGTEPVDSVRYVHDPHIKK